MTTDTAIGSYLVHLREEVGLSQKDLASRIGMSPTLLSRVESGERSMPPDELDRALTAIGSEASKMFKETVGRVWERLPKPPPGHLGESMLWDAEHVLQEIDVLLAQDDILMSSANLLDRLKDEVHRAAHLVAGTEYSLAFVGALGVGKSTAICRVADLEVPGQLRGMPIPVLETGGGRMTICEVRLEEGSGYGIQVEPMSYEEIEREVREFASSLKEPPAPTDDERGDPAFGTSREIGRAIRNMSGLARKTGAEDPARKLAEKSADTEMFTIEIMARMNLDGRTRREIWHSRKTSNEDPLSWLKDNYARINNGGHSDFSIPKLVAVVVTTPILGDVSCSIRLVDTKGIDRTAERADLENLLNDPNTAIVMCSGFADIPSQAIHQFLEQVMQGGPSRLEGRGAVLGLVRHDEAWSVKDDMGSVVDSAESGYALKRSEAQVALQALGFPGLRVEFFNAKEDSPAEFKEMLRSLVQGLRQQHRSELEAVINTARSLFENFEEAEKLEVMKRASEILLTWIGNNRTLEFSSLRRPERRLIQALRTEHASSIRASVRRDGEWQHFDYDYYLRGGVRFAAERLALDKLEELSALIDDLSQVESLLEASSMLEGAGYAINAGTADIRAKCNLLGTRIHLHHMKRDQDLWAKSDHEWGRGSGYRNRVAEHHEAWFEDEDTPDFREPLMQLIQQAWDETLESLDQVLVKE